VTLATGPLREIPVVRETVRVYFRTVHLPAFSSPDPLYTLPGEGRWPTNATLYTGSSVAVAWAEYCRNHAQDIDAADVTGGVGLDATTLRSLGPLAIGDPLPRRALYELVFAFERLADLMTPWSRECLEKAGFPISDFYSDYPYGICPDLAEKAVDLGWEAIRVPSVAWQHVPSEHCVPVFSEGRARLQTMRETEASARPTVAVACATAYPVGRRPAWL
jgi:hypothetical protein